MVTVIINFAAKTRKLDHKLTPVHEKQAGDVVDREVESKEEDSGERNDGL